MPAPAIPRIAVLGFSIECNKFAPPATKADFLARTYLEGDDILKEARAPTPTMLPETPGFVAAMDAAGPWQSIGIAAGLGASATFRALTHEVVGQVKGAAALVGREGYDIGYVDVVDRPRGAGVSNYGLWDRLWVGILDLAGVWWLIRRKKRVPEIVED